MLLAVANRPIDTNTTYTTGGEVSRFQRRSVPAQQRSGSDTESLAKYAAAIAGRGAPGAASAPVGPVVRIARGNNVTVASAAIWSDSRPGTAQ